MNIDGKLCGIDSVHEYGRAVIEALRDIYNSGLAPAQKSEQFHHVATTGLRLLNVELESARRCERPHMHKQGEVIHT